MAKEKVIEQLKNDPLMPLRHSAEHVLHTAMQELYPNLKKVMGPPIKNGFYFDFDLEERISEDDFPKIEKQMQKIIDSEMDLNMRDSDENEIKEIYEGNKYKLETLAEIVKDGAKITVCEMGNESDKHYDLDLCAGPHTKNTKDIKAFKLLSVAGAYYKGDEKNKMLQRIYGTAFDSKKALEDHLERLELAKERDHRKIGKELELFTFSPEVGAGLPLWLPKGTIIKDELEKYGKEVEAKHGYQRVSTPHLAKESLYITSGHLPYYADDMYPPMEYEGENYYVKPMNCPHTHMIYKSRPRTYKELPLRYAEFGTVYRNEDSGTLMGIMRVRGHTTNDAHIYCTEDQAVEELVNVLKLHEKYYEQFNIKDFYVELALPDLENKKDKYAGDPEKWEKAISLLKKAAEKSGITVVEKVGGAAFYGPKFDFQITSAIGREFGASTNQLDFGSGERFGLKYVDKNGSKKTLPYIVHRAPLGSHERFIGFLIEHYGGAFPTWLSPVQVEIIPISDKHIKYAEKIKNKALDLNLRVEVNDRDESMGAKIRNAQLQKIPYMLVVGDKEEKDSTVSLRLRDGKDIGAKKTDEILSKISEISLTRDQKLW